MSSNLESLPPELRQRLQAELAPGERVQWAGQPDWRACWPGMLAIGLFGAGWTAISGFFAVHVLAAARGLEPFKCNGEPAPFWMAPVFGLFLLPFLAIGFGCLLYPLREVFGSARRVHAVTDRRLLTVETGRFARVESHLRDAVNFVRRTERDDGSGTLVIGYGVKLDADGDPRPLTMTWSGVQDVAGAEKAMRQKA